MTYGDKTFKLLNAWTAPSCGANGPLAGTIMLRPCTLRPLTIHSFFYLPVLRYVPEVWGSFHPWKDSLPGELLLVWHNHRRYIMSSYVPPRTILMICVVLPHMLHPWNNGGIPYTPSSDLYGTSRFVTSQNQKFVFKLLFHEFFLGKPQTHGLVGV
jgi:hypothetical protein